MTETNFILDQPVSLGQNFKLLKEKGITYIQEYCGSEWTNYNPSDPGITILEQVCYALTELGYCQDFPIEDILSTQDGQIAFENQFFSPEQIFTTSPVTIQDYRKLIIDEVEEVVNVFIEPVTSAISKISRAYRIHLYLNPALDETDSAQKKIGAIKSGILKQVFFLLNRSRNWGELFLMPQELRKKYVNISGTIEIDNSKDAPNILRNIQETFEELIFPYVPQVGYDFLQEKKLDTSKIFNGPLLKNGWIEEESLKDKCNVISREELSDLISGVDGVKYLKSLAFINPNEDKKITARKNELLVLDLEESLLSGQLIIECNGKNIYPDPSVKRAIVWAPRKTRLSDIGANVRTTPELPQGSYREIESYYSIQNTFPEAFGVGDSGINSNATAYQIAQSRQLKGYLTLFDQQLANQFAQLANVRQLFSFKHAESAAPFDKMRYFARKDKLKKQVPEYPAPYNEFSPTYFCQSLYHVPHIQPLLKGNQTFDFSLNLEESDALEEQSWNQFKDDPYNSYMRGLTQMTCDGVVDLQRRNAMLDHLLARHGESPALINAIIDDKLYTGDPDKGKLIFKSLLLQQLQLLSYNRYKCIDYLGADAISSTMEDLPDLEQVDTSNSYQKDFIFDLKRVEEEEELEIRDFTNFSATELKLSLLFGLNFIYKNYFYESIGSASNQSGSVDENIQGQIQIAQWLSNERRGLICIEPGLLLKCLTYKIAYLKGGDQPECHVINEPMNYHQALGIEQLFKEDLQQPGVELSVSTTIDVSGEPFSVVEVESCDWAKDIWQPILGTQNKIAIEANWSSEEPLDLNHEIFSYSALFLFPDFVPAFIQDDFQRRVSLFLGHELPVHIEHDTLYVGFEQMKSMITLFCDWRKELKAVNRSSASSPQGEEKLEQSALLLIQQLLKIYEQRDG